MGRPPGPWRGVLLKESVRRRAAKLARVVAATAGDDGGPIHLVGHSTGGLDARLIASPGAHLMSARFRTALRRQPYLTTSPIFGAGSFL